MRLSEMDRVTAMLSDYLDVQSRRAEVVASNLANADTPGFKARELEFSEFLKDAAQSVMNPQGRNVKTGDPNSLQVVEQVGNVPGVDGNTVDAGRENAAMADLGMQFLTGTQLLQARFRTIRAAIREGR
jgi:flagellar basal-body rod protein FlgB